MHCIMMTVFISILTFNSKSRTSTQSLGIDPGFGSSKTAFTVIECVDSLAHVIYSKQFEYKTYKTSDSEKPTNVKVCRRCQNHHQWMATDL
jgi:hypothetical protein